MLIAAQFDYTDDDVRTCVAEFQRELDRGLRERTPTMCQIPTYITRVARGTEKGTSLAVDLGGTNLRVCSVDLHGDTTFTVLQSKISIPQERMVASDGTRLFSFIAKQVESFLKIHHADCSTLSRNCKDQSFFSLGFTFSFPAYQNGINSGVLLRWTKGFDIPGVVGQDVCRLLQFEIDRLHLPVKVTALVNDAAGTIMSRAYTLPVSEPRTSIGAIFGTGTNGVYLEKLSKITKPLDGQYEKSTGEMFLSIEWGSFDNRLLVLPNTSYDIELNEVSVNPGNQMFEKRVSGMFLGELLRIALSAMHTDPKVGLFNSKYSSKAAPINDNSLLQTRWAVDSSILSVAEADNSEDLTVLTQKITESLGIPTTSISVEDARAVKIISHAIGKRAARLAGMAVGAVVLQSQRLVEPVRQPIVGTDPLIPERCLSDDERVVSINSEEVTKAAEIDAKEQSSCVAVSEGYPSDAVQEHDVIDIGVDGSVIEYYPKFETYMREALKAVKEIGASGEDKIKIGIAKDGSSVGAAIIALLATQQNLKKTHKTSELDETTPVKK
ncbi:MAG: glucokinase [Sclerophora amabilis]|nr:MAG: glucokinase [Sclerophora amabilis]